MTHKLTRRTLMQGAAATGLATAFGGKAALASEPLGISLVIPSAGGRCGLGACLEGRSRSGHRGLW
jgi:basic membrane protein A